MLCDFCGEAYQLDVLEYWPEERAFMLMACCELAELDARETLASVDRREFAEWWSRQTGESIRGLARDRAGLARIDHGLHVEPFTYGESRDFVAEYHRHNAKAPNARSYLHSEAIYNGSELIGVSMIHRPAARAYNGRGIADVARVCIKPMEPAALAWNACSQLYGSAARWAKRSGFNRIITYTLQTELATSLRAAGWTREAEVRGKSWGHRPGRSANVHTDNEPKWRWGKRLAAESSKQLELFAA